MNYFRVGYISVIDKFSVEFTDDGAQSWITFLCFDSFDEADAFMRGYVAQYSDTCALFEDFDVADTIDTWCGASRDEWAELYESACTE